MTITKNIPFPAKIFKLFCIVLFSVFSLLLLLSIGTSKKNLYKISYAYVSSVDIDSHYSKNYYDYGFTEEICANFINSKEIYSVVAECMTERLLCIFKNADTYMHDKEYYESLVLEKLRKIDSEYGINLTPEQTNSLTAYTCDIIGVSSIFIYDSPAAYRTATFDDNKGNFESYNKLFILLAEISKIKYAIAVCVMYVICLVVLTITAHDNDKLHFILGDTAIMPGILLLALSVGQLVRNDITAVVKQVNKLSLLLSAIMIAIGGLIIGTTIVIKKIPPKKQKED